MQQTNDEFVGKKIKAVPKEEKNFGVDTQDTLLHNIVEAGISSNLDTTDLENFLQVAHTREAYYQILDTMKDDNIVKAVIEAYAENSTISNDAGNKVWVESEDPKVQKYVTYLLKALQIDKNIYSWTSSFITYGDCYLKLYRQSEYDDDLFDEKQVETKQKLTESKAGNVEALNEELGKLPDEDKVEENQQLNEGLKIAYYDQNDHFTNYVEMVINPGEMFELTKFGKTMGYIKAPYNVFNNKLTSDRQDQLWLNTLQYDVVQEDVTLFQATDYVHAVMDAGDNRVEETVNIYRDKDAQANSGTSYSYKVKRGKSMLYDWYKTWREMSLLEDAIILNRLTKSSLVRIIQIEVGDMPKDMISSHLQSIKAMMEQKGSLDTGNKYQEYNLAGPIENNIYVPTHEGKGNISVANVGGDYDPKQLTDLEYFRDKFFGSTGIPKQFFGFTEDGAGFNGGESLTIISSQFAKRVKKIQSDMLAMLDDLINTLLYDRKLYSYINNFSLKMVEPLSQEDKDRKDAQTNALGVLRDTMDVLGDISDVPTRLKIIKTLIQSFTTEPEILDYIQDEIDRLEQEAPEDQNANGENEEQGNAPASLGGSRPSREQALDNIGNELFGNGEENNNENEPDNNEGNVETNNETNTEQDDYLPSFSELGVDSNDIEEQ